MASMSFRWIVVWICILLCGWGSAIVVFAAKTETPEVPNFKESTWKFLGERVERIEIDISPVEKFTYSWAVTHVFEHTTNRIIGQETYALSGTKAISGESFYKAWGRKGMLFHLHALRAEDGSWTVGSLGSAWHLQIEFKDARVKGIVFSLIIAPKNRVVARVLPNPYYISPRAPKKQTKEQ